MLIRPAPNKMASWGLLEGGRRQLRTYPSWRHRNYPSYLPFHWMPSGAVVVFHQSKCICFFYGLREVKRVASSIGLKKEASTIKIHPPTRIPRWRASDRATRGGISRPCAPLKAAVPDVTGVRATTATWAAPFGRAVWQPMWVGVVSVSPITWLPSSSAPLGSGLHVSTVADRITPSCLARVQKPPHTYHRLGPSFGDRVIRIRSRVKTRWARGAILRSTSVRGWNMVWLTIGWHPNRTQRSGPRPLIMLALHESQASDVDLPSFFTVRGTLGGT
ncbi:hypothetical protein B296_00027498 [Ensete ventricosum]|uniref:Uncharacterized protein n=1 Tax=Ensete ventricosum TaxID=4639 RepID=A0A426XNW5_ENSVE|nr:hypothetical protein B296_00027498 [Ensete ventricosum]